MSRIIRNTHKILTRFAAAVVLVSATAFSFAVYHSPGNASALPDLYFEDFSKGHNPVGTIIYGDSIGSIAYSISEKWGWNDRRSVRIDVRGDFFIKNSSAAEIIFEDASFFVADEVHFSWMMWGADTFWSNFANESKWMGITPRNAPDGDPRQITFTKLFNENGNYYMIPGASAGGGTSFFHDEFYQPDYTPAQEPPWFHWSVNTGAHTIKLNDSIANQWIYFEYRAVSAGNNRMRVYLQDGTMMESLYQANLDGGFRENDTYSLRWLQQFDDMRKVNSVDANSYGFLDYIRVATFEMGPPAGFLKP